MWYIGQKNIKKTVLSKYRVHFKCALFFYGTMKGENGKHKNKKLF